VDWTRVADSGALRPGEVTGAIVGDEYFVVWRTEGGRACVMDDRCPHQWSSLAAEGRVEGDELVCTAHCWRFDPDGRGSKLTVLGRRDPKSDVRAYPAREVEGRIEAALRRTPG
jgi:nitrite reductase/ring-hydroxylating ferredoxin subunit